MDSGFSWINPKLEVRDTNKYGFGIFTKREIKKKPPKKVELEEFEKKLEEILDN